MKCQRCLRVKEAKYRVFSDIIDMNVCATCAEEARRLGITVEVLDGDEKKAATTIFMGAKKKAVSRNASISERNNVTQ